jgi:hypothetical protein
LLIAGHRNAIAEWGDGELQRPLVFKKKEGDLTPRLPSAHTSDSIHREEHRFPKGKNMTGNTKGGAQWETRAAKRTKTRTGNRRRANTQKI